MKNLTTKLFSLSLFLCLWTTGLLAQSANSSPSIEKDRSRAIAKYELQDCIRYAFQYRESIKKAEMDVRIATAEVGENISRGIPKIDASVDFNQNFKIRSAFFTGGAPDGSGTPATTDSIVRVDFGTKFGGEAQITLEQLIFDFSYLLGLRAARSYQNLQTTRIELSKSEVVEQVAKAYYGLLVTEERLNLVDQNLKRLDTLLRETKILRENGFAEKIDVMRTEVAYNNILMEKQKALGGVILAR
ncbi:MAG: TolC family protein, partial [Bacteroidota bacterium]